MGYDLHVTRKDFWAEETGPVITAEEWLAYVDADPSLTLDPRNGSHFALWNGQSEHEEPWICWSEDRLYTKNPDPSLICKLLEIAADLGAKVQGDDGEVYTSPTDYFYELYEPETQQEGRPASSGDESAVRPTGSLMRLIGFLRGHR